MEDVRVEMLRHPTGDDWMFAKRCALVTMGLRPVNPPSAKWMRDILEARHSPIRELHFAFLIENLPSWVATHFSRHVHAQPYIGTQRNDRQDRYDRDEAPQGAMVPMIWTMSAEELMTVANKRLCGKASEETRYVARAICEEVIEADPEMAPLLVPNCMYNRCHEMRPCGTACKYLPRNISDAFDGTLCQIVGKTGDKPVVREVTWE